MLKDRLQNGLDKLISTAQVVSKLQEDITALKPVLVKTVAEVEEMIGPFLTSNALILPPPPTAARPPLVAFCAPRDSYLLFQWPTAVNIDKDKADAAVTQVAVEKEESSAKEKAAATKAIADDAQRDLDEALPALDAAVQCLKDLKKGKSHLQSLLATFPQLCRLITPPLFFPRSDTPLPFFFKFQPTLTR